MALRSAIGMNCSSPISIILVTIKDDTRIIDLGHEKVTTIADSSKFSFRNI